MENMGNGVPGEGDLGKMEGLQKWRTWGNGGDLGKRRI